MATFKVKTLPGTVPFAAFRADIAPGRIVHLPPGATVKDGVLTLPAPSPDKHRILAELTVFEARFLAALLGSMTPQETFDLLTKTGMRRKVLADVVTREMTSPKLFHELDAALSTIGVDPRVDIVDEASGPTKAPTGGSLNASDFKTVAIPSTVSFKVGDRVMCAITPDDVYPGVSVKGPHIGARGTVVDPHKAGYASTVLVEWDAPTRGHADGGRVPSGRAWYVNPSVLRRDGDFRVGDRVVVLATTDWDRKLIGQAGVVRAIHDRGDFGVQIDPPYSGGHTLTVYRKKAYAPEGRGWWLSAKELRLA